MPVNVQRGIMRVLGIVEHHVTVVGVQDRAPWLRRVRFFGASLVDALEGLPGEWIRLWVPDASQEGLLRQRGYIVVAFSREGGWFDLDMVLHEPDGPASAWARAVRPGAEAVVSLSKYGSAHVGKAARSPCSAISARCPPSNRSVQTLTRPTAAMTAASECSWTPRGTRWRGYSPRMARR